jgi:hypothetical protein
LSFVPTGRHDSFRKEHHGWHVTEAGLFGLMDNIKMGDALLPLMGVFRKYGQMTIQEFAQHFQDSFLRSAVRFFVDIIEQPVFA